MVACPAPVADRIAEKLRLNAIWSNRRIAAVLGVHHASVAPIRAKLIAAGEISPSNIRERSDGLIVDTSNIGRNPLPAPVNAGVDLTGQRFGRLVVMKMTRLSGRILWLCRCDCGGEATLVTGSLKYGHTQSCGCLHADVMRERATTLSMRKSREYKCWINMRSRCANPKLREWKHYGGRGITVCPEWGAFEQFYADMGVAPTGLTLDRIDVNGNYTPENCRWATPSQQCRNTRVSKMLTFQSKTKSLPDWADEIGVHQTTLHKRLQYGWSVEDALTRPLARRGL